MFPSYIVSFLSQVFDIEKMSLLQNFQADENPICTLAVGNGMLFSGSLKSIKVKMVSTIFMKIYFVWKKIHLRIGKLKIAF